MTLEQICVNKEWAEKLKEAGFPQDESLFYWCTPEGGQEKDRFIACIKDALFCNQDTCSFNHNYIATPTASELLERLPSSIDIGHFLIRKHSWGYSINIMEHMSLESNHEEQGKSLANALTKMLIWLVKNEYINFKD